MEAAIALDAIDTASAQAAPDAVDPSHRLIARRLPLNSFRENIIVLASIAPRCARRGLAAGRGRAPAAAGIDR